MGHTNVYIKVITLVVDIIKRLRKVGNSNALILDKPILELLGLEEGGEVQLTVQDGNLIVTPARPRLVSPEEMSKKLEYVIKKRKDALRRLAK
jgi:putative addiction module antidote